LACAQFLFFQPVADANWNKKKESKKSCTKDNRGFGDSKKEKFVSYAKTFIFFFRLSFSKSRESARSLQILTHLVKSQNLKSLKSERDPIIPIDHDAANVLDTIELTPRWQNIAPQIFSSLNFSFIGTRLPQTVLTTGKFFTFRDAPAAPIRKRSKFIRRFRWARACESDMQVIFNYYACLRQSSFSAFFIENRVDTPVCFMKSPSLKRRHLELNLFKFTNFLMRNGNREKMFRSVLKAFWHVLAVRKAIFLRTPEAATGWSNLYFFLNNALLRHDTRCTSMPVELTGLVYNHLVLNSTASFSPEFRFKRFLQKLLRTVAPLFQCCIYKVAKNVRKFSRGKAGRYVFVWRYVPRYKRTNVAMRLISKDIRFNKSRKLFERISKTLIILLNQPTESFIFKAEHFTNIFVFNMFKKTFLRTLKSAR
jgi:hypothetical protein